MASLVARSSVRLAPQRCSRSAQEHGRAGGAAVGRRVGPDPAQAGPPALFDPRSTLLEVGGVLDRTGTCLGEEAPSGSCPLAPLVTRASPLSLMPVRPLCNSVPMWPRPGNGGRTRVAVPRRRSTRRTNALTVRPLPSKMGGWSRTGRGDGLLSHRRQRSTVAESDQVLEEIRHVLCGGGTKAALQGHSCCPDPVLLLPRLAPLLFQPGARQETAVSFNKRSPLRSSPGSTSADRKLIASMFPQDLNGRHVRGALAQRTLDFSHEQPARPNSSPSILDEATDSARSRIRASDSVLTRLVPQR